MANNVTVLGCGPAGLLAAHAATQMGRDVMICSVKKKSVIGGAQYLHRPIPGVTVRSEGVKATFIHHGDRAGYAARVYGDPQAPTSWEDFNPGEVLVWNMRDAYDRLWARFQSEIVDCPVTAEFLINGLLRASQTPVLSTIPAKAICPDPDNWTWKSQDVWIDYGQGAIPEAGDMEIVYNGATGMGEWYRASSLFGWSGLEFSQPRPEALHITKPLSTTWPGLTGVYGLGRYGRWTKRQLIHNAYEDTIKLIEQGLA